MTRKELQKISLQYRTLASQMLKINSQEEMYCIQQFYDFINETSFLMSYIDECIILLKNMIVRKRITDIDKDFKND